MGVRLPGVYIAGEIFPHFGKTPAKDLLLLVRKPLLHYFIERIHTMHGIAHDAFTAFRQRDAVDALERIGFPGGACDAEGSVDMPVSKRLARDGHPVQTNLL